MNTNTFISIDSNAITGQKLPERTNPEYYWAGVMELYADSFNESGGGSSPTTVRWSPPTGKPGPMWSSM